jgi:indole-3-glycerol phosphate synthase
MWFEMKVSTINFQNIINQRSEVLKKEKVYRPLDQVKKAIKGIKLRRKFKSALQKDGDVSIICEYKPASPSHGPISDLKVGEVLPLFESGGARAASIITETNFFKSSIENLKIACKISKLPLLRKDFIMDEYQIYESRASGASAILLMADICPNLSEGILLTKYLGMDALVECKNELEIKKALDAGAEIIGVNNRNFTDFTIDLKMTKKLAGMVPTEVVLVAESGVKTAADVVQISSYGADAILVGTSIMESADIAGKISEIVSSAKKSRKMRI